MRHSLVMGNWKLNGSTHQTRELINQLRHNVEGISGCEIVIAPPVMYLDLAKEAVAGSHIKIAAQNSDVAVSGAFTGDISTTMLKDIGAEYVILGHSERRTYHHESDELIAKKFVAAQQAGLKPVLCIGETEQQNSAGETEQVCKKQLDAVLAVAGIAALGNSVIAYEPVWAIGTGKSATPEQAQQVHRFIREYLAKQDATIAEKIIILYGGSVNNENAEALFTQPDIDGALVGGASLKADAFTAIIAAAAKK